MPQAVNHSVAPCGGEQAFPRRKPPQRVDLTSRLVLDLSLECEVDCDKPELSEPNFGRLPA